LLDSLLQEIVMEDPKICLVVLIGLPGSGKSSFCNLYSNFLVSKTCDTIHVCYDKLISLEAQAKMKDEAGRWKAEREKIHEAVELIIKSKKGCDDSRNADNEYSNSIMQSSSVDTGNERSVILIDDNNYLQSMRYEYYQLARDHKLGFAQLYFDSDQDLAKKLNSKRPISQQIPEDVIVNMAAKLEPPKPFTNKWEAFSFTLVVQEGVDCNLDLVDGIVEAATKNPILPVETVSLEVREKDRIACKASTVHQADKYLRGLVNKKMGDLRSKGLSKEDMKVASHNIYNIKGEVLEDLKTGFTKLDRQLVESVQNMEDGSGDKLSSEIEQLFNLKLSSVT